MGTWVYWVLYKLPATITELPEKYPTSETLTNGAKQGVTDFKRTGYTVPCPTPGKLHRYCFKLYALDSEMALQRHSTRQELLKAMHDHVLADASLIGGYQRRP